MERELIIKRLDYLREAAEQGSVRAQVSYALYGSTTRGGLEEPFGSPQAFATYKANALRFLERAAQSGDVSALTHLAFAYRDGMLATVDEVQALGHMMAAQRTGMVRLADRLVTQWSAPMCPGDVRRAKILSVQIFDRCGHKRTSSRLAARAETVFGTRLTPETVG